MCIRGRLSADKLRTAQHVAPLVIAAELHIAAVFLVQHLSLIHI